MNVFIVCAGAAALIALWGVSAYNRLVRLAARREEGWSGILVQLKRRHDLVPNLAASAKGLAGHEKELMESVTRARAAQAGTSVAAVSGAEGALSQALGRFIAVAENYPQIKSDAAFTRLMGDLSKLEDELQLARRYYNGTAREYNVAVQSFPSRLIASLCGYAKAEYFELESNEETKVPKVEF